MRTGINSLLIHNLHPERNHRNLHSQLFVENLLEDSSRISFVSFCGRSRNFVGIRKISGYFAPKVTNHFSRIFFEIFKILLSGYLTIPWKNIYSFFRSQNICHRGGGDSCWQFRQNPQKSFHASDTPKNDKFGINNCKLCRNYANLSFSEKACCQLCG
jgi:hypothetical protein